MTHNRRFVYVPGSHKHMCGKCSLQLCRQKQALSCACCKLEVPSGTHTHTHTHTHKTNDAQPTLYVCSLRSNTWPRASKRGWNGQFQGRSSSASASEIKMPPLRAQVHKRTRQTPPHTHAQEVQWTMQGSRAMQGRLNRQKASVASTGTQTGKADPTHTFLRVKNMG
jgi:hypothetical protein